MTKLIRAKPIQRERGEQMALIHWAMLNEAKYPALKNLFAIPNGGSRNIIEAANLKRSGVKAGVPDLFLAYPRTGSQWPNDAGSHGLFIEMKAGAGQTTDKQVDWIDRLRKAGYTAEVCYGWENAMQTILEYLGVAKK